MSFGTLLEEKGGARKQLVCLPEVKRTLTFEPICACKLQERRGVVNLTTKLLIKIKFLVGFHILA